MADANTIAAQQAANYFLWKASFEKRTVSNKKLQKLLYYAQAWSLVLRDKKLFEEKIEAWVHGPAIREIYFKYKKFGFAGIKNKIDEEAFKEVPDDIQQLLNQVWVVYGKYDSAYLEHLTHSESPWQKAREGLESDAGSNNEIDLSVMKEFYGHKFEEFKSGKI